MQCNHLPNFYFEKLLNACLSFGGRQGRADFVERDMSGEAFSSIVAVGRYVIFNGKGTCRAQCKHKKNVFYRFHESLFEFSLSQS